MFKTDMVELAIPTLKKILKTNHLAEDIILESQYGTLRPSLLGLSNTEYRESHIDRYTLPKTLEFYQIPNESKTRLQDTNLTQSQIEHLEAEGLLEKLGNSRYRKHWAGFQLQANQRVVAMEFGLDDFKETVERAEWYWWSGFTHGAFVVMLHTNQLEYDATKWWNESGSNSPYNISVLLLGLNRRVKLEYWANLSDVHDYKINYTLAMLKTRFKQDINRGRYIDVC